jgi:hypothetical protein
MLGRSLLLYVAIAAQAVVASPLRARSPYAVKETHSVPRTWTPVSRAPGDHMLHMQIGLKQDRFDELERHLYEGEYTSAPAFRVNWEEEAYPVCDQSRTQGTPAMASISALRMSMIS